MSTLLDSLAAGFDGNTERRSVLDAALRDGLPGPRSEGWKYTSLRALERRVFAPAMPALADIDPALLADIPAPRLVFVNGRFDARHSDATDLPAGVALLPLSQVLASRLQCPCILSSSARQLERQLKRIPHGIHAT